MTDRASTEAAERLLQAEQLPARQIIESLAAYEALIRRWNRRYRLVSRRDVERLWRRHLLDSLALLPWWRGGLVDVGAGAGLPGVPLALARPQASVLLVERSERSARFLRQAVIELDLANVEVAACDVRAVAPGATFETVTVRAVAPPAAAWLLVRHLLAAGAPADGERARVLLQSQQPLAGVIFEGGETIAAERAGIGWVTAVARLDGAP